MKAITETKKALPKKSKKYLNKFTKIFICGIMNEDYFLCGGSYELDRSQRDNQL